ncbi:MAG: GlsB/YeaQ/YmgE family stress response membrane protein [Gemmatimonadales bacterium]|nr:GlsB/YeaQ/YmgE family stress response membrane protein [Gemmatimonadales bacterium]MDZ4389611.1 GlsB/YeaQ/YmgE family stress response membrane protein [Gemmatimonadales bacterium]
MDLITWLVVGLLAGLLASFAVGGAGYGLFGDVVIGICGAVVGGWLFGALGLQAPFVGLGGVVFVAFVGAVVLLLTLRALRPRRSRRI